MSTHRTTFAALVLAAAFGAGCTTSGQDAASQRGGITGGKDEADSPLVLLLPSTAGNAKPACVGTLLGERVVVTERHCADKRLIVKRASAKSTDVARVQNIRYPDEDAEEDESAIALIELDGPLPGKLAKIAPMDMVDGYHVVGAKSLGTGGESATRVKGKMKLQTATEGLLEPEKGKLFCDSDVGAAVFRKMQTNRHTAWELSGVIIDRGPVPPPQTGATPPPAGDPSCSANPRRVAPLALHAEFFQEFAPEAMPPQEPKPDTNGGGFPLPDTNASGELPPSLRACNLVTETLAPRKSGERTAVIQAKATFTNATKESIVGQFGVAPKDTPAGMTWAPAILFDPPAGPTFDSQFEGGVDAPAAEGDYIVAFRASADGGRTWTECDLDGSENGFAAEKALSLQVSSVAPPITNPAPETPVGTLSEESAAAGEEASEEEEKDEKDEDEDEEPVEFSHGGCGVAHSTRPGALPLLAFVALAALRRRRRA
jgi:MYXO-CTERM domain-containing protein